MPKPQPWYTSLNQPSRSPKDGRYRRANTPPHNRPTDRANPRTDDPTADWSTISRHTIIYTLPEPKPSTIPYAGIRAGELIGHRLWLVLENNQLCSLAHHFIWEPEAVVIGEVDKPINALSMFRIIWGGTYSFRDDSRIASELMNWELPQFPALISFDLLGFRAFVVRGIACGTIKCWGEVIEHEHGYRAQYAKLTSIQQVIGAVDITALRERYKI